MAKITAYCMKCKSKVEMKDPKAITHPNGRAAIQGVCPKCGGKVFRMGKMTKDGRPVPAAVKAEAPEKVEEAPEKATTKTSSTKKGKSIVQVDD